MRVRFVLSVMFAILCMSCGGGGSDSPSTDGGDTPVLRMNPAVVLVNAGSTATFTVTAAGISNPAVTWSVLEGPSGGSINAGVYTAPALGGTFHVVAQSQSDPAVRTLATAVVSSGTHTYTGTFTSVGPTRARRYRHNSTLMPDGRVLIVGGTTTTTWEPLASSEWFNPATGSFTDGPTFTTPRLNQGQVLLPDGKLLVIGGSQADTAPNQAYNTAELYDPATGVVSPAGTMATPRGFATATLLADGRVLVAGGYLSASLASAELWDPRTKTFSPAGSMGTPRSYHTATLLPDGRVMIVGGRAGSSETASVELFDPATNSFVSLGSLPDTRSSHDALLLPDGRVLVVGGHTGSGVTASILAITPGGAITAVGNLQNAESGGTLVRLHNGKALLVGGSAFTYPAPEIIDLTTFATTTTLPLTEPRSYVQGHALRDGSVFVGIGISATTTATNHGDLYR
ncbi:MAG: kelch repeat-containing protein [Syntrophales bacterium]